jgi:hypothetical protein
MSDSVFNLFQQHVATRLGVAEEVVRELRQKHLTQDRDFARQGNRILYSAAAVGRLQELLQVPPPEEPMRPEASAVVVVEVVRALVNPHYVLASLDGKQVEVRVRDNRLLLKGMKLECVREGGRYVCPRVPRRKGVW